MALKTTTITIHGDKNNRDEGKKFLITELPASKAERWAVRALYAVFNSNIELPEGINADEVQGINGLSKLYLTYGLRIFGAAKFELIEPLYQELIECCEYLGKGNDRASRKLDKDNIDEIIEEVSTLVTLRIEAFKLHIDFLDNGENLL